MYKTLKFSGLRGCGVVKKININMVVHFDLRIDIQGVVGSSPIVPTNQVNGLDQKRSSPFFFRW